MTRKRNPKAYWQMTMAELREATKQFDDEFVAEKSRPLNAEERALWERIKAEPTCDKNQSSEETIAVRLDKALLERCTALAKKKRLSRDTLVARGLRALLAAEGE